MNINLHGTWNYLIENETNKEAFKGILPTNTFNVPGTTNENKIGTKLDETKLDVKEKVKCLREHFNFTGAIWYQKEIEVNEAFLTEEVELFIERVMFESKLYVNGDYVGRDSSLSTPHRYTIKQYLQPGKNTITLRIDNTDVEEIGVYASAMTIDTQTVWNGMIGRVELRQKATTDIEKIKIFPYPKKNKIRITFTGVTKDENKTFSLRVQAVSEEKSHKEMVYDIGLRNGKTYEISYPMRNHILWDEHNPHLYKLKIGFNNNTKEVSFGMRDITTKDRQILVNNVPTFLLGTLECCIFPLTGYPETTRPYWEKIYKALKEYGLNHIRFHSWCPPEIAFDVADEFGIYIQAEAPLWLDNWQGWVVGSSKKHYDYIPSETKRIIDEYGNHPSFIIFSNGNELNGDFDLLEKNIHDMKKVDNRFLYTLTSNWDRKINKEDDIFISQTVDSVGIRGQYFHNEMAGATNLEFEKGIQLRDVPVITHEVGQYTIFPSMKEISKYNGLLEPTNLKHIKGVLEENNIIDLAEKYTIHSGKTSYLLYRDEIESALRTRNLAGIQLLDLHDFPGQSTAHVGILDAFWDSKGLVDSKRFREFSNRVVPLLVMNKKIFTSGEHTTFGLKIANYLNYNLNNKCVRLVLKDSDNTYFEQQVFIDQIHYGNVETYQIYNIELPEVNKATTIECIVTIEDTEYTNRWNIHVFPLEETLDVPFHDEINNQFLSDIKQGKNMIFNPRFELVKNQSKGCFFPVFWSPVHFTSDNPNGLIINNRHDVFESFETDDYATYQWRSLLDNSVNMDITNTKIKPIIDVIPNFIVAKRLTNMFEVKIGDSNIVVTTMDLKDNLDYRHEARTLRNSISRYVKQPHHHVANTMTIDEFKKLFYMPGDVTNVSKLKGVELGKGKPSKASSELNNHEPYMGNNGLNYTFWAAGDYEKGHFYEIDLGQTRLLYGTKTTFEKNENYLYAIRVSLDGEQYETVVNQTGRTDTARVVEDVFTTKARYIQIVYNGLPKDVRAGHYSFEIFGE